MMMKAQGVDEKYIDKEETLYYDESGNIKHLIVKEGKLNADSDTVFVQGGVQADDTISLEELKTALGKSLEKEMKSTKDLKGSFIEILRKDNFRKILQLIQDKGWHIHFSIVQILYYGFVDIVDSIDGLDVDLLFAFKAELYKVLKKDPNTTVSIFKKYKYPNVATKDINNFLSEILTLIESVITEDAKRFIYSIYNQLLLNILRVISQKYGHNLQGCILKGEDLTFLLFLNAQSVSIKGVSSLFSAICSLMFPSFHVFGTKVRQFPRTATVHSYQSIILEGVKSAACQISLCRK